MSDAAEDATIVKIGLVVVRLRTENFEMRLDLDLLSRDPQIVEVRAQKADLGHATAVRVLGDNLRHHMVGGEHFEDVQAFDHGSGQRGHAGTVRTGVPRDLAVATPMRNDAIRLERPHWFVLVTAGCGQFEERLSLDYLKNRLFKIGAEDKGIGVVSVTCIDHWYVCWCSHIVTPPL
jgi:hypothetical protein